MPSVPRIRRAIPASTARRAVSPIPVVVRIIWHAGPDTEHPALVLAWTASEVEVQWRPPVGDVRSDWIRADQVLRRRLGADQEL